MKKIYNLFISFFSSSDKGSFNVVKEKSFFDYSSGEKIRIMRAAGRQAKKEQQQLLRAYESRFGRSI